MASFFQRLKEVVFKSPNKSTIRSFFHGGNEKELKRLQAEGVEYKKGQNKNKNETCIKEREK